MNYQINQEEIDELKRRFPNNGSKKSKRFRDVIIWRLLAACEQLLKLEKEKNK